MDLANWALWSSPKFTTGVVSVWQSEILPRLVLKYEPRNIFNADECGLFLRLMPDKSFVFKGEKCHGGKLSKERVTALVGANSDGSEKLPLLMMANQQNHTVLRMSRNFHVSTKIKHVLG